MMRERFVDAAAGLLDDDQRVAVVLAAISADVFAPLAARHPDRVIDVGIREQLLVGAGAGMGLAGMRPILHTYAPFLIERSYEQVKLDLGHQDAGAVLVSVGASYDWAEGGQTHRGHADVALLDTLDGWHVHVPGHPDEVEALLRAAVADGGRHYLRLSTAANREPRPVLAGRPATEPRVDVVRRGSRGTVLAVGPMLDPVLAGIAGLDVTVLHAVTVRPLDAGPLRETLSAPAVVLVEPYLARTSLRAVEEALAGLAHRTTAHGVGRRELRRYGEREEHDRAHGLDADGIALVVRAAIGG
jgi:transketolase